MKAPRQKRKRKSKMDASIGVNLRVTAHSNQGGRKYMEDMFCVAYQPTSDERDLLYAYFGIFDGHGGGEAAYYAKTHLMDHIVSQKNFWSNDDDLILKSIREGFISVHHAMWRELDKWPKTQSGLPSTSGTTASVAFVRRGKLYIGHVGDSGIVLGYQDPNSNFWKARPLTNDHKPESPQEHQRIQECGGKVVSKSGVPRVVWNRPRLGHKGPVRRSTLIDEIPFLAVARSLGDLWSYNSEQDEFVVSPEPDVIVIDIDVNTHRCLILGSDGLWNMLTPQDAVNSVYFAEKNNERQHAMAQLEGANAGPKNWINPSKRLVDRALDRWYSNSLRADNTSVVTVVIDPPGPPKPSPRQTTSISTPARTRNSPPRTPAQSPARANATPSPRNQRTVVTKKIMSPPRSIPRPRLAPPEKPPGGRSVRSASGSASTSRESSPRVAVRTTKRRRKLPVSSKASRVLGRNASKEPQRSDAAADKGKSLRQGHKSEASNQSLSDNQEDVNGELTGGDVQIHEISSSSSDQSKAGAKQRLAGPPPGTAPKPGKIVRVKLTKHINNRTSASTSAASATAASTNASCSRKRLARQTDSVEDEAESQRKIMKVSNETVPASPERRQAVSKLRNRGKVSPKTNANKGQIKIVETKENGRKLPQRVASSRITRGNAASFERPPPVEDPLTSGIRLDTPDYSKKSPRTLFVHGTLSQNRNDDKNKVTIMKKKSRGSSLPPSEPSTSKRLTRALSSSPTPGIPIMIPVDPNSVKLEATPSKRTPEVSANKTSLKRLQGKKDQRVEKEKLPTRRVKLESDDVNSGAGQSNERSLRSAATSMLRVTRSSKKQ